MARSEIRPAPFHVVYERPRPSTHIQSHHQFFHIIQFSELAKNWLYSVLKICVLKSWDRSTPSSRRVSCSPSGPLDGQLHQAPRIDVAIAHPQGTNHQGKFRDLGEVQRGQDAQPGRATQPGPAWADGGVPGRSLSLV